VRGTSNQGKKGNPERKEARPLKAQKGGICREAAAIEGPKPPKRSLHRRILFAFTTGKENGAHPPPVDRENHFVRLRGRRLGLDGALRVTKARVVIDQISFTVGTILHHKVASKKGARVLATSKGRKTVEKKRTREDSFEILLMPEGRMVRKATASFRKKRTKEKEAWGLKNDLT